MSFHLYNIGTDWNMEQMLTMSFYLLNLYHDSIQDKESFKW